MSESGRGFLSPRTILALLTALALPILLSVLAVQRARALAEAANWVSHTRQVQTDLEAFLTQLYRVESLQRQYILTGASRYLDQFNAVEPQLRKYLETVRQLTLDNPREQQRLQSLGRLLDSRLAKLNAVAMTRQSEGLTQAAALAEKFHTGEISQPIDQLVLEMQTEEEQLLNGRSVQQQTLTRHAIYIFSAGLLLNYVLFAAIYFLIRSAFIQRQRAEARIATANAELLRANQELEAFSYSVSHDLRAPLRGIEGFANLLERDYVDQVDETGRNYLQRIRAATVRMGQLIEALLGLSRVSRSELRREEVDLSAIASSVVDELRRGEPERPVEAEITGPFPASADPHLIRVVLTNLLGNAWKFSRHAQPSRIEFGATGNNGSLAYYVRDNGAGFDMAYQSQLFSPFQRLHRASEFEGTGIGLTTVQRIIHRHGGRIWAESSPGQGATFYFTLQ